MTTKETNPKVKESFTTGEVIQGIRDKSEPALIFLYNYYAPALQGIICKTIRDKPLAEEVLQKVFLNLWNNAYPFEEGSGRFYTWLILIANKEAVATVKAKNNIY